MTERTDKARETLLKKFGSEEALREHYRDMKRKSMQHPNNRKGSAKGGFNNTEIAKQAGIKGRAKRYGHEENTPQNQDTSQS